MIRKVGVIGLGSIGGFLVKHLSENKNITNIVLADFDVVEMKNINKSIYNYEDIGELKVDALANIIKESYTPVTKRVTKYIEGKTWLPKCDLLIDCRDFVYDRFGSIDIRIYITGRKVIIDCSKKVINNIHYSGNYNIVLTKEEISRAAYLAYMTIISIKFLKLLKKKEKCEISIDQIDEYIQNFVDEKTNTVDMIYDTNRDINRLQGINENIYDISESNKLLDIPIYISVEEKDKPDFILKKGLIKKPIDLINLFGNMIRFETSNFAICFKETKYEGKYVVLREETAAA